MAGTEADLMALARAVRDNAYAPYSRFRVGAALEDVRGAVFTGCNVENASYGLSICAERAAVVAAVAAGSRSFVRMALSTSGPEPAAPCGACRQVLMEFSPGLAVTSEAGGVTARWTLADLLPEPFRYDEATGQGG